jgi:hypothetical protein
MRQIAAQILTASQTSALDVGSVRGANPWVSSEDICFFLTALGVSEFAEPVAPEAFALPGRPALERFFREYVIEPNADPERYQALRVRLSNGNLYGPPGSGKTHAVGYAGRRAAAADLHARSRRDQKPLHPSDDRHDAAFE